MTEETEIDRTVVILGHSYVRRLKEFIDAETYTVDHEFNIQNKKIDVRYISIPGAKTQTKKAKNINPLCNLAKY